MNTHTIQILEGLNDPHNRVGKIKQNYVRIANEGGVSNELLALYNDQLEKDFHKKKLSVSGWEKSLSESIAFARFFDKPIDQLEKRDIERWWKYQEQRLMDGEIAPWTIRKYVSQARKVLRFAFKHPKTKYLDCFDWITEELPAKPKRKFTASDLPSQEDIKRLIDTLYEGTKLSARNRAIIALCNDCGLRVGEALELRNKDIKLEQNYLVISVPKSKTETRTVVSVLARPYLETWEKISPNRAKGKNADCPFFCGAKGKATRYPVIRKALNRALKITSIQFPKGKKTHFFRAMFASRAHSWGVADKNYWLGWAMPGVSGSYTALNYKACIKPYMEMLKAENNPMLSEDLAFWEEDNIEELAMKRLKKDPMFEAILRKFVQETMAESTSN